MRRCFVLGAPFVLWACATSSRPVEQASIPQRAVPVVNGVEIRSLNVSDTGARSDAMVEPSNPLLIFWFFGDRPTP
jgi:hypothetical protein